MLIVRVTRSVAIGDVSIATVPVCLAGEDSVSPHLVGKGNENGAKNHTNVDGRPGCKETLTFFGHHRQAQASVHYTASPIKRLDLLPDKPRSISIASCRYQPPCRTYPQRMTLKSQELL